ncbi:helix-turn-helix domain-containing protein [Desulfomonile tiedjei]|uniref:Putative transcriptional regulator n=1 Tax=Desulfomonile tiedjei (strain ATCC 49306 / DSM 6799 / DCB-1) TaxID=706587 RepID=I4C8Z8_DESTA|nr:helix-turn-helix transcriptional regulator [Desulfomonile tiedjei]AFM26039.1 putative transcriptional regulator [Desulfomonile tiedjei DSM 6799]
MIADQTARAYSLIPTDTPSRTPSPLHDQFYGIEITEKDRLSFSLLLEKVCDGLGHWYLSIDPEFQKDVLAGSKIFWERKQADADVKVEHAQRTTADHPCHISTLPTIPDTSEALNRSEQSDQTAATIRIRCTNQNWTDSRTDPTPTTQKRPGRTRRKNDSGPLKLRYYREQAGISQKALGELIGCKQNRIFLLENGLLKTRPDISPEDQKILEDTLGAPFDELIQPIRTA